jgi:hypothetical protein
MPIRSLIVLVLALAALSGCGRRGELEPAGTVETNAVPSSDASTAVPPGTVNLAPVMRHQNAPQRSFILDPLI